MILKNKKHDPTKITIFTVSLLYLYNTNMKLNMYLRTSLLLSVYICKYSDVLFLFISSFCITNRRKNTKGKSVTGVECKRAKKAQNEDTSNFVQLDDDNYLMLNNTRPGAILSTHICRVECYRQ